MDKRFYRFLQATCCNWRNSFFIDCQRCDGCSGFLLSVNHNAVPSIIPVAVFEELSGETVDKYDCVGIMTLEGFQRFYTSWLVWNVEDPKRCSLRRCDMDHYKDIEEIPMIFGPRELSKILGISKNKTYEVVNRYDFPKIRVGRRIIISKKHFLEWMDANFGKERNNT